MAIPGSRVRFALGRLAAPVGECHDHAARTAPSVPTTIALEILVKVHRRYVDELVCEFIVERGIAEVAQLDRAVDQRLRDLVIRENFACNSFSGQL